MLSQIQNYLSDHPWACQIQYFDTIDSTNTYAKQLAAKGAPEGTVIIANRQTGGRGRMGRSFSSPAGMGIYMSVILRPEGTPAEWMHLTCAGAVAANIAVEQATGLRPGIKWTNDLVYNGRKLAGILTELVTGPSGTCAIIGIGINCSQQAGDFPEEIRHMAGSVSMATGAAVDRAQLAAQLIWSLYHTSQILFSQKSVIMDYYRRNCITVGKDISLVLGNSVRHGHACGIDDNGALEVRFPDGSIESIHAGEVSIRGMYGYV